MTMIPHTVRVTYVTFYKIEKGTSRKDSLTNVLND